MGKKTSWFIWPKKVFIPGSRPKREEKPKKWGWFFKRIKSRQCPALECPQEAVNEATDEQRKHAMAVAIATAAAAEAAVAAANAAAEVVRLTSIPYKRRNQHWAAIKIQSAYRGHLAKKALSALKGLVKLQAVIRGELVRRNVDKTLPSLSWISKATSQVHNNRIQTHLDYLTNGGRRNSLARKEGSRSELLRPQSTIHRSWDLGSVSKEDIEALYQQKQEAIAKRERMKQYSFSQRELRDEGCLQESMMNHKENRNTRSAKSMEEHYHEGIEKSKPLSRSNTVAVEIRSLSQLKQRAACKVETIEESHSLLSQPRRSFCHVKQKSISDDGALLGSSIFPAYMAATKSTKAKSRSLSTPKQRLRLWDTYSGELSPSKPMLSPWSSFSGEIAKNNKRNSISQHPHSYYDTLI